MQVLKRPEFREVIKRIRLNQDYGLVKLKELVVERVNLHAVEDSECYTQTVTPAAPEITVYDVWLGDRDGHEYTSIQCGQSGELWLWAECWFCYVNYVDFECYAGPSTGWENLIRRIENFPIGCGNGCYDFVLIGMTVPESGDVAEFLQKAGLDCKAKKVVVCGKVIYKS